MKSRKLFQFTMVLSLLMLSCILSTSLLAQVQNKRVKPPVDEPITPPGPEGSYRMVPTQAPDEINLTGIKRPNLKQGPRTKVASITSPFTENIPVIDGVVSPGEWSDAYALPVGGSSNNYWNGSNYCMLWVKNTCRYLYIASWNQYGTSPNTMGSGTGLQNFFNWYFETAYAGPPDGTYCTYGGYPAATDVEKMFTFPDAAGYPIGGGTQDGYLHGNRHYQNCLYTFWLAQRSMGDDPYANGAAGVTFARTTSAGGTYFEVAIDLQASKLRMPIITSTGANLQAACCIGYAQGSWGYIYGDWGYYPFYGMYYSWLNYDLGQLHLTGPPPGSGGLVNVTTPSLNTTDFVYRSNQSIQWSTNVDASPAQTLTSVSEIWGPNTPSASGPLAISQNNSFAATPAPQQWNVTIPLSPPTLVTGFYDLYVKITFTGTCGPVTQTFHWKLFVAQPGEGICYVWPGDVDNNKACNLADRQALNTYIYNANTRPTWLNGPPRFRTGLITGTTTPLDIFTWIQQPAKMWQTPLGCYMDADGNGNVNNLDLFALKFNIGKSHTFSPKNGQDVNLPMEFALAQNYPNPFNPTTNILYALPEESFVNLKVTDVLGREVRVLVNETVAAGTHSAVFNAVDLPSGVYYYAITAHGIESGTDFAQTLKMSFTK